MKKVGLFLAALLTLTGEGTAPVRHLEYAFAIYPTAKPNGGLFDGTLSVDILGTAPDGGMWVQASEWWYYTLRPRQTRQCEVFPGGSVRCDDVPPYPSETELVLFPLLASGFFGGGWPDRCHEIVRTETASEHEKKKQRNNRRRDENFATHGTAPSAGLWPGQEGSGRNSWSAGAKISPTRSRLAGSRPCTVVTADCATTTSVWRKESAQN